MDDWLKREYQECVGISNLNNWVNTFVNKYSTNIVLGKIKDGIPTADSEQFACEVWTNINSHVTLINIYSLEYL